MQFVIPGIIVQTVVFSTALTGTGLNEDVSTGIIDRFRSLPIARSAVLGGRILADAGRLVATVVVIVLVGVLLGFRFGGGPLAALAGFLLIIAFGMACPPWRRSSGCWSATRRRPSRPGSSGCSR